MRRNRLSGCTSTKMFSATVRSGKSVGSWKMIAMPAACDCLALSKIASSPSSRSRPESGRWTPARILTSVDLPAPFSPTSPCTSAGKSSMWPSASAWTAPKLFSACSREMTGAGSVVVTIAGWRRGRRESRRPPVGLELELVDVLDGEHVRRTQDHLRPLVWAEDDLVRPELACLERLADLARDLAVRERRDRVSGEIAEVLGVPESERLDRPVVDV